MAWPTTPGSGALTIDGDFWVSSADNILLGSGAFAASGKNVISITDRTGFPPSSLGGASWGNIYVQSGGLHFMGKLGTITIVGSA